MFLTRKAVCFVSVCHVVKARHLKANLATKELETMNYSHPTQRQLAAKQRI